MNADSYRETKTWDEVVAESARLIREFNAERQQRLTMNYGKH